MKIERYGPYFSSVFDNKFEQNTKILAEDQTKSETTYTKISHMLAFCLLHINLEKLRNTYKGANPYVCK